MHPKFGKIDQISIKIERHEDTIDYESQLAGLLFCFVSICGRDHDQFFMSYEFMSSYEFPNACSGTLYKAMASMTTLQFSTMSTISIQGIGKWVSIELDTKIVTKFRPLCAVLWSILLRKSARIEIIIEF